MRFKRLPASTQIASSANGIGLLSFAYCILIAFSSLMETSELTLQKQTITNGDCLVTAA